MERASRALVVALVGALVSVTATGMASGDLIASGDRIVTHFHNRHVDTADMFGLDPLPANGMYSYYRLTQGDPNAGEEGNYDSNNCAYDVTPASYSSAERFLVYLGYPESMGSSMNTVEKRDFIRKKLMYVEAYLKGRSIRWECSWDGFRSPRIVVRGLSIKNRDISAPTDLTIDEVEQALRDRGHTVCRYGCSPHQRQSYLVMVDGSSNIQYCGLGWPGADGSQSKDKFDRRGGVVADVRCWDGAVILHELIHTQAAVFRSAPNSDGGHHCWGEHDVMCESYSVSPWHDMQDPCPSSSTRTVDCGSTGSGSDSNGMPGEPPGQRFKEDYYDPTGGQFFLSSRWNTADSLWYTTQFMDGSSLEKCPPGIDSCTE